MAVHRSIRLTGRTWARGIATTYGYAPVREVNSISHTDGTPGASAMAYGKGGLLIAVTDASGSGFSGGISRCETAFCSSATMQKDRQEGPAPSIGQDDHFKAATTTGFAQSGVRSRFFGPMISPRAISRTSMGAGGVPRAGSPSLELSNIRSSSKSSIDQPLAVSRKLWRAVALNA